MKIWFAIIYIICVTISLLYFVNPAKKYGVTLLNLIGIILITLTPIVNMVPIFALLVESCFKLANKLDNIQLIEPRK